MMTKGKKLSDHKREYIEAFSKTGMGSCTIEIKIGRSKIVVNYFLKLKETMVRRILEEDLEL